MLITIQKFLSLFNKSEKKKLLLIFLCIICMGIIEMVAVATIFPFLAVVTKPEIIQQNYYLNLICQSFTFSDSRMFMLFLGVMVFVTLVAGNIFSAFTSSTIIHFCFNHGKKLSCEIFQKYLSQPYIYFLSRHTSDLTKNMLSEVDKLVIGIFISSLNSISKLVVMAGILILLLLVEPLLALSTIFILGGAYFFIYFFIRKKLSYAGQVAAEQNAYRYKLAMEILGSIKELKVLGREQTFLNQYAQGVTLYTKAESLSQLSPLISRYMIEAIAFGGMVLIALYLIGTQKDISKFMPLLGLYALAGYRLMPAMQQLFTCFSSLRFNLISLDTVFREMKLSSCNVNSSKAALVEFKQQLQLKEISYSYPSSKKIILNQIDLSIPIHSTIGIVGASGAGKTTLVDIILGLLAPVQGTLKVDNVEIDESNLKGWQSNIGYVPQNIALIDASIAQNIAFGISAENIDSNAIIKAAKLANLDEFITKELPQGYDTRIGERGICLSGGQRQRIGIARALYHDPELLIFDEATSALDGVTEKIIMEAIKYLGHQKTIILIAHRLNTVKECDVIYVLNKGKLVGQGTYQSLLETNQAFKSLASQHMQV